MKRERTIRTVFSLLLVSAALGAFAAWVKAAPQDPDVIPLRRATPQAPLSPNLVKSPDSIENLIVMVECHYSVVSQQPTDSPESPGAGIIFGIGADCLYIATADHVVREGLRLDQKIQVRFFWQQDKTVEAALMRHGDGDLDLAVLKVEGIETLGYNFDTLPFDKVADADALVQGNELTLIGYPEDVRWLPSTFTFTRNAENKLYYRGNAAPGYSGGALLKNGNQIVGMHRLGSRFQNEAINIQSIISRLEKWNYPVRLGRKLTPVLTSIATKEEKSCGIATNGQLFCWGLNLLEFDTDGNIVSRTYDSTPKLNHSHLRFKQLYLGERARVLAIVRDGTPYFWSGEVDRTKLSSFSPNPSRFVTTPHPLPGGLKLASGGIGLLPCGITVDGETYCWETADAEGEIPQANQLKVARLNVKLTSVSVGQNYACGIGDGGAAFCWGKNESGQLGDGSSDKIRSAPSRVAGGHKFVSLSAGWQHTCGIAEDGIAYCWGNNNQGELGSKSKKVSNVPEPVSGGVTFKSISVGQNHTFALRTDGAAFCWGNLQGMLPGKNLTIASEPVRVPGETVFKSLNAGSNHTCALTTAGVPQCWGRQGPRFPNRMDAPHIPTIQLLDWLTHPIKAYVLERRFAEAEAAIAELKEWQIGQQAIAANFALVWASYETRQYSDLEAFLRLIEQASPSPAEQEELFFWRALRYQAVKNYDAADAELQKLLSANPNSARAYGKRAEILLERGGSLSEALKWVQRAVDLDPAEGDYLATLGRIYYEMRELENARKSLEAAWRKRASYLSVSNLLGDVYCRQENGDLAIFHWRIALEEWKSRSPLQREVIDDQGIRKKIAAGCPSPSTRIGTGF